MKRRGFFEGRDSDQIAMDVIDWNKAHPIGTPVLLLLDNGSMMETTLQSEAWQLGDGTPVVLVDGKSGGWKLSRIYFRAS